jgi:hypothetical protein
MMIGRAATRTLGPVYERKAPPSPEDDRARLNPATLALLIPTEHARR